MTTPLFAIAIAQMDALIALREDLAAGRFVNPESVELLGSAAADTLRVAYSERALAAKRATETKRPEPVATDERRVA